MDTRHVKARRQMITLFAALITVLAVSVPVTFAEDLGLAGKKIVLDAGHGGHDTGARGAHGIHEKVITLAVTKKLAVLLREGGAQVKLTRTVDDDLATDRDRRNHRRQRADLVGRYRVAERFDPDAFISVHCNASTSSSWHGAQVLYMPGNEEGKALAKEMQNAFREQLLQTNRSPAGVKSLFLLKRIDGPTVLAEIGFISNPEEARQLTSAAYQDRVALAMYTAILRYFDSTHKNVPAAAGRWHRAWHSLVG